jgi:hypothetical protein
MEFPRKFHGRQRNFPKTHVFNFTYLFGWGLKSTEPYFFTLQTSDVGTKVGSIFYTEEQGNFCRRLRRFASRWEFPAHSLSILAIDGTKCSVTSHLEMLRHVPFSLSTRVRVQFVRFSERRLFFFNDLT